MEGTRMSRRQLSTVLGLLALAIWGGVMSSWVSPTDRSSAGRSTRTDAVGGTSGAPSTNAGGHATSYARQADTELPAWLADAYKSLVVFGSTRSKRGLNIRERISIL